MKTSINLMCTVSLFMGSTSLYAQPNVSLEDYSCRQFLADVARPDSATKLLNSMMMIAWATGYAAAHQQSTLKSDTRSFELIAAALGDSCRKAPDTFATKVIADTIERFAK